jgi:hypothetical protein
MTSHRSFHENAPHPRGGHQALGTRRSGGGALVTGSGGSMFTELPSAAAFVHHGARSGFEVSFFRSHATGMVIAGGTSIVEKGEPCVLRYAIHLDSAWVTRQVDASAETPAGPVQMAAIRGGGGRWTVNGAERPDLDGCVDVDFESSLVTNTIPIHRLGTNGRAPFQAPAAFVSAHDLGVTRLEQTYAYSGRSEDGHVYQYDSATYHFQARLTYDQAGVIREYPGLGRRHS